MICFAWKVLVRQSSKQNLQNQNQSVPRTSGGHFGTHLWVSGVNVEFVSGTFCTVKLFVTNEISELLLGDVVVM